MTETTQAERNAVQEWAANHSPIRLSANLATRLKEDADRLAKLEDGIRAREADLREEAVFYEHGGHEGYAFILNRHADKVRALLDGE